jgi:5-methylcytosine-specific restriction endonuclease McrA
MNNRLTAIERRHVAKVKELACSVCDEPGPSEAHHVKQGKQWTVVALCPDCHRGAFNGLHGQRRMWNLKKMDEVDALAVTIKRLMEATA